MLKKAPRLFVYLMFAVCLIAVPLACSSSDSGSDGSALPAHTGDAAQDMTRAG